MDSLASFSARLFDFIQEAPPILLALTLLLLGSAIAIVVGP